MGSMDCDWWKAHAEEQGCKTLIIDDWKQKSPAYFYPAGKEGRAEIRKSKQPAGLYIAEGVLGYDFTCNKSPIPITRLFHKGHEMMHDEPWHELGMEKLAEKSKGKVLVGGLGLGLVASALVKNPKVSNIDVWEINPHVINLVKPYIDPKINVMEGDIYEAPGGYDTVILDMWVTTKGAKGLKFAGGADSSALEMRASEAVFQAKNPGAKVFIWGVKDRRINPAWEKNPCKLAREIQKATAMT